MTTQSQKKALLKLAVESITEIVSGKRLPNCVGSSEFSSQHSGVFVTVFIENQLRGCIGYTSGEKPLGEAVYELAQKAATEDMRFNAVQHFELQDLSVEITLMGTMETMQTPSEIEIGTHGVYIEQRMKRGILLPQVASERNWTAEQFLEAVCEKARLPLDAWKNSNTTLKWFEAEMFSSGTDIDRTINA